MEKHVLHHVQPTALLSYNLLEPSPLDYLRCQVAENSAKYRYNSIKPVNNIFWQRKFGERMAPNLGKGGRKGIGKNFLTILSFVRGS